MLYITSLYLIIIFFKFQLKKSSLSDKKDKSLHPAVRSLLKNDKTNKQQEKINSPKNNKHSPSSSFNKDIENSNKRNLPTEELLSSKSDSIDTPPRKKLKSSADIIKSVITNPIPHAPETESIASRSRLERFQEKKRIVIGNTYQYIAAQDACSSDVEQSLKYKWQVYVRGPPEAPNIGSFITSVTFTLDQSYSPHDVIVVE